MTRRRPWIRRKPRLRLTAALLAAALLAGLTPAQALADDGNGGETAQLLPESALWQPEQEQTAVLNTEGDLSFVELQQRELPAADLPEVLTAAEAVENGHVHRLRAQEEDLNTVVFQNRDGTKTMYSFADPVKYIDTLGRVRDKTNAVAALTDISMPADKAAYTAEYQYTNAGNDIRTYFPKTLSGGKGVVLERGEIQIEMIPVAGKGQTLLAAGDASGGALAAAEQQAVVRQPLEMAARAAAPVKTQVPDEESSGRDAVEYAGVFGAGTTLRYTPTFEGFKEDIILESYGGVHEFTFRLKTNGLTLVADSGRYFLVDPLTGEAAAALGELIVDDSRAAGEADAQLTTAGGQEVTAAQISEPVYSHQFFFETVTADEEYLLTVAVDEDYLLSGDTVYPVYVDPSAAIISQGSGSAKAIQDAAVYSGAPNTAHGGLGYPYNVVGYQGSSRGTGRVLFKFPGLINSPVYQGLTASSITSAKLHLRETSGKSSPTAFVSAYMYTGGNWTENTVTYCSHNWNSLGEMFAAVMFDSSNAGQWCSFDLTDAVKWWKTGAYNWTNGILLRNTDEGAGNGGYERDFAPTEYSSTYSLRPYVTLNYTPASQSPTAGIVNGGTYYIRNDGSAKYLEDNKNGGLRQNPKTTVYDDIPHQRWRVEYYGHGLYRLKPMNGYEAEAGLRYAMKATTSSVSVGNVSGTDDIGELFAIVRNSNGTYTIRPAVSGNDRALGVNNTDAGGAAVTSRTRVSSDCYQWWQFNQITSFSVKIDSYYDYGYQARFGSSAVSSITARQTRVNNFLSSVFNVSVINNTPALRISYADLCRGPENVNVSNIELPCSHLAGKCDEVGLCEHVMYSSGTCNSSCKMRYHHNNSFKIHDWFIAGLQSPSANINAIWTGHRNCEQALSLSTGTYVTLTLNNSNDSNMWEYVAFHEIGHSLGALGDNICTNTSCAMSYSTEMDVIFSLVNNPSSNTFCEQCKEEIKNNLCKYF